MRASFVTVASVIAMPTPIEADPPEAALPLAVEDASAASLEWSVSAPPLETIAVTGIVARALAFATVTAIAAATLIGPPEVEALGVPVGPEVSPPFAPAVKFANPRWLPTWLSTLPPPLLSGAPAALPVAVDDEVDGPNAVNMTAPAAVRARSVVASAVWFEDVSAIAAPIAAEPLDVLSPEAVVFAVAVVDALKVAAPDRASGAPVLARALPLTLLIATT